MSETSRWTFKKTMPYFERDLLPYYKTDYKPYFMPDSIYARVYARLEDFKPDLKILSETLAILQARVYVRLEAIL